MGRLFNTGSGTDKGFGEVGNWERDAEIVAGFIQFDPFKMAPTVAAPSFDGKGESLANYAQDAELWSRATNLDAPARAPAPVLQMGPAARDVCTDVGGDQSLGRDGILESCKCCAIISRRPRSIRLSTVWCVFSASNAPPELRE